MCHVIAILEFVGMICMVRYIAKRRDEIEDLRFILKRNQQHTDEE